MLTTAATKIKNRLLLVMCWIVVGALSRLLPHPANVTPLVATCLLTGSRLSKSLALFITLATLLISDVLLAILQGQEIWGGWALFTYSGFIFITLGATFVGKSPRFHRLLGFTLTATLFFWLWTNLGVWLITPWYPKTVSGFIACYTKALPFLGNSLLGDSLWLVVFYLGLKKIDWSLKISSMKMKPLNS